MWGAWRIALPDRRSHHHVTFATHAEALAEANELAKEPPC